MVIAVTGSASLAGLTVGLFGVSRFLVSYPTGKITDTFGRKPGILFGQGLTMVGSVATGLRHAGAERGWARRRHGAVHHGRERRAAASRRRGRHVSAADARAGARLRRHRLAGRHCAEPAGDGACRDRGAAHRRRVDRPAVADAAGADRRRHGAGHVRAARPEGDRAESPALLSRLRAAAEAGWRAGRRVQRAGSCCGIRRRGWRSFPTPPARATWRS